MIGFVTPSPSPTVPAEYFWVPADHFGLWQLIVAILGLGFAGWQLLRTARATEATNDALTKRLLHNDLLFLLPEIQRLEDDFDAALASGNRDIVANTVLVYYRRVSAVVGHLKSDSALSDEKAITLLSQAAKAASLAKGELHRRSEEPVASIVKNFHKKMLEAGGEVLELTARLQKSTNSKESS